MSVSFRRARMLYTAALIGAAIGGCGASQPASRAPTPARLARLLRNSAPPLASIHAQANQLLGGGRKAFEARLAALHGHPVVANIWASWCGPCRTEAPFLQFTSAHLGRSVAFLGVNALDDSSAAKRFLARFPVNYPSYEDPSGDIARALGAGAGVPMTAFFDRVGRQTFLYQGPTEMSTGFLADIENYTKR